ARRPRPRSWPPPVEVRATDGPMVLRWPSWSSSTPDLAHRGTPRGVPLHRPRPPAARAGLLRLDLGHGGRASGRLVDLVQAGAGSGLGSGAPSAPSPRGLRGPDPHARL